MIIHTSNFSRLRHLDTDKYHPISVALYNPKYLEVLDTIKDLAPNNNLLRAYLDERITEYDYVERYTKEILQNLDVDTIITKIKQFSGARVPVLLCHCGATNFCHRHLIAKWLKDNGYNVSEYGIEDPENPYNYFKTMEDVSVDRERHTTNEDIMSDRVLNNIYNKSLLKISFVSFKEIVKSLSVGMTASIIAVRTGVGLTTIYKIKRKEYPFDELLSRYDFDIN